ncbi:MAG TPA: hypothetical protein VNK67_04510 [Burkholderiales bacterium]|nr:hypothetical protein [Burkholderiales bacterium]
MGNDRHIFVRLIAIEERDVNLKFFFDHFRNYFICAALGAAARYLNTGGEAIPYLGVFAGTVITVTAIILFFLNTYQGALAVSILVLSGKGYVRGVYTAIWLLIAASYVHLLFVRLP